MGLHRKATARRRDFLRYDKRSTGFEVPEHVPGRSPRPDVRQRPASSTDSRRTISSASWT